MPILTSRDDGFLTGAFPKTPQKKPFVFGEGTGQQ
jgi:hypothetical protein